MRALTLLLCLCSLPLLAEAGAPSAPPVCIDPVYHQFDFWLGDWTVTTPDGKFAGHNRVEKHYGDCVLQENWTGAKGGSGSSFNIYDASRRVWHQTWVDSSGMLLELEGGLHNGSMVMSGVQAQADGKKILNRITWTPNKDGSVRQQWDVSSDGGKTWKAVFDGIYRKAT